jgi:hypothetical protein
MSSFDSFLVWLDRTDDVPTIGDGRARVSGVRGMAASSRVQRRRGLECRVRRRTLRCWRSRRWRSKRAWAAAAKRGTTESGGTAEL